MPLHMLRLSWLVVGILTVLLGWHGGACAQQGDTDRIDALQVLLQKDIPRH
jgi:hypothetical protein